MSSVEGIRALGPQEVQERFQLDRRLMQRVGAWRSRCVDVTPGVLEEAARCDPLTELLLEPGLLPRTGARLDEAVVTREVSGVPELAVLEPEAGWQLIALAEEVAASAGWGGEVDWSTENSSAVPATTSPADSLAGSPPSGSPAPVVASHESALLFSPEQVAALKLEILAGTDDEARRGALRRIALSDLSPQEKGLLYLVGLREGGDALRREAATQLGALGMNEELVKAFRTHAGGDADARRLAFRRLRMLGATADGWEETVATSVLVSLFAAEEPTHRSAALDALRGFASRLASDEALLAALLEVLVPPLVSASQDLAVAVVALLVDVTPGLAPSGRALVRREADGLDEDVPARRARSLLLAGICSPEIPADERVELAEALLQELEVWSPLTVGMAQVELGLLRLGEAALEAIDRGLSDEEVGTRMELVSLVDRLVSAGEDPRFTAAGARVLARNLEGAPTMLASLIRQSPVLRRSELSAETRRDVARHLVRDAHLQPDRWSQQEIVTVFEQLGGATIPVLLDRLAGIRRADDRRVYLEALGAAALGQTADDVEAVRRAIGVTRALFHEVEDPGVDAELAVVAHGRLCTHPELREEELDAIVEALRAALWRTQLTAGALEALGFSAIAPRLVAEERVGIVSQLLRLTQARLPSAQGRRVEAEDGTRYELDDTETYATRLPALIVALQRVACAPVVPHTVRVRVVETLLERWDELIEYRVIWGPANVALLAEGLEHMAVADLSPPLPRLRILRALRRRAQQVNVAGLLALAGEKLRDDRELDALFGEIATDLIDLARDPELCESLEDREQVLVGIARLLVRPNLADSEGRDLTEEMLAALYSGLLDRVPGIYGALRRLQADEGIAETWRTEIGERLRRAGAGVG